MTCGHDDSTVNIVLVLLLVYTIQVILQLASGYFTEYVSRK